MDENLKQKLQAVPGLFSLADRVAVVTGGGAGLGRGMALALAAAGADIVPVGRTRERLEEVCAEVCELGREALPVTADVTHEAEVEAMVKRVVDVFGRIDILINSAGMIKMKPTTECPVEEWEQVMRVNLEGVFIVCKHVGRAMLRQQRGKVINVSSVRGHQGRANDPAYPASKGAVNLLTKSLAIEWAQQGITVNAIAPTYIRTDLNAFILDDPAQYAKVVSRIPMGRVGQLWDLFGATVFLAAPASDFITGQILYADGGWTAA